MSLYKKIGIGLCLFVVPISLIGNTIFPSQKTLADTSTPTTPTKATSAADVEACIKTLSFQDLAHITCTTPEGKAIFNDVNPTDSGDNGTFSSQWAINYSYPTDGIFCKVDKANDWGRGISSSSSSAFSPSMAGKTIKMHINVGYSNKKAQCVRYNGGAGKDDVDKGTGVDNISITDTDGIKNLLQFSDGGSTVSSLDGLNHNAGDLKDKSYALSGYSASGYDVYTSGYAMGTCSGEVLIVRQGQVGGNVTAMRYVLKTGNGLGDNSALTQFLADPDYGTTGCAIKKINFQDYGKDAFGIRGTPPPVNGALCDPATDTTGRCTNCQYLGSYTTCTIAGPTGGVGPTTATPGTASGAACEDKTTGFVLAWIMCPVFNSASEITDTLNSTFLKEMSFTVNGSPADSAHRVAANQLDNLKTSWGAMRNIASAFLVIVMLVMIFSQAISFGPFDAYTLRKMLPKMVIAIILMQFSWVLFNYAIDTVNFIGNGVRDLLYAPFGGAQLDNLGAVLHNAGVSNATATGVNWVGIIGIIVAVNVAFPILCMFLFMAGMALLVGLGTLIFRRILIIICLITAPIAMLVWIMPSQSMQKLFKMWSDNFSKSLMMYPLAVLLIASGRVFAWVSNSVGGENGLVVLFMVLIGYFGPLFMLPKTFKWGGTAMAMAGKGLTAASTKLSERPKKYFQARQESLSAERRRQSQERYAKGVGFKEGFKSFNGNWKNGFGIHKGLPTLLWRRPSDLMRSGQFDPLLASGNRRRYRGAMSAYRAAGAESEEKEMQEADRDFGILANRAANHDHLSRRVGLAKVGDTIMYRNKGDDENADPKRKIKVTWPMKRAGLNAMDRYGTDATHRQLSAEVNRLHHGKAEEQYQLERFLDSRSGTLKPKMDTLFRGPGEGLDSAGNKSDFVPTLKNGKIAGPQKSGLDALADDGFATQEAPNVENLLASFATVANDPNAPPALRAQATESLQAVVDRYQAAKNNKDISGRIGPAMHECMEAFMYGGTGLATLNTKRTTINPEEGLLHTLPTIPPASSIAGLVIPPRAPGGGPSPTGGAPAGGPSPTGGAPAGGGATHTTGTGGATPTGGATAGGGRRPTTPVGPTITRGAVNTMGETHTLNWMHGRDAQGGNRGTRTPQTLSNSDLMTIRSTSTGEAKTAAASELERRGIGGGQSSAPLPLPGSGPALGRIVQENSRAEGSYPVRDLTPVTWFPPDEPKTPQAWAPGQYYSRPTPPAPPTPAPSNGGSRLSRVRNFLKDDSGSLQPGAFLPTRTPAEPEPVPMEEEIQIQQDSGSYQSGPESAASYAPPQPPAVVISHQQSSAPSRPAFTPDDLAYQFRRNQSNNSTPPATPSVGTGQQGQYGTGADYFRKKQAEEETHNMGRRLAELQRIEREKKNKQVGVEGQGQPPEDSGENQPPEPGSTIDPGAPSS